MCQQQHKVLEAMGEIGVISSGSFCEKCDLYGCTGLKITDAESLFHFCLSDLDIEKYLLASTPAVRIFVTGKLERKYIPYKKLPASKEQGQLQTQVLF